MIVLLQRVLEAQVVRRAEGGQAEEPLGAVGRGLLAFVCAEPGDSAAVIAKAARKTARLRIFEDENGKTNLDIHTVGGELLLISQFTLYANCRHGNRPSFIEAGKPDMANEMYEYIIAKCKEQVPVVEKGEFGADMKVELLNDGPFTILLDSDQL